MKVKQVFVLGSFVHISLFSFFICLPLKERGCWNSDFSNSTIIMWQILQNACNGEGNEFSQRSPLKSHLPRKPPCSWFLLPFSNCLKWEMYSATSAKLPEILQYQPLVSCGAGQQIEVTSVSAQRCQNIKASENSLKEMSSALEVKLWAYFLEV